MNFCYRVLTLLNSYSSYYNIIYLSCLLWYCKNIVIQLLIREWCYMSYSSKGIRFSSCNFLPSLVNSKINPALCTLCTYSLQSTQTNIFCTYISFVPFNQIYLDIDLFFCFSILLFFITYTINIYSFYMHSNKQETWYPHTIFKYAYRCTPA